MPVRRLPVRPDLDQLHRQAKEFLHAIHAGDAEAIAEFREHHPKSRHAGDGAASRRHRFEEGHGGGPLREYRDVTPLGWGDQFYDKIFVSGESLRLIEARGGTR